VLHASLLYPTTKLIVVVIIEQAFFSSPFLGGCGPLPPLLSVFSLIPYSQLFSFCSLRWFFLFIFLLPRITPEM
jgi:hypothetical protein